MVCISLLGSAHGATYFVRPQGNDQANGVSPATAFRTLARAAAIFQGGDSVVLAPGAYREPARFMEGTPSDGRAMSITGDESGALTGTAPGAVVIVCSSASDAGIGIHRFRNLTIRGLTFRGVGQGLAIERAEGITVDRCTFDGLARGVALSASSDIRVESAVFLRCTIGLALSQVNLVQVNHVTVAGCSSVGMLALTCGPGQVRNSLFRDNNTNMIGDALTAGSWTSDRNVLSGTTGPWGDAPAVTCPYEWFGITGQERNSCYVAPAFRDASAGDLHIAPTVQWGGGLPGQSIGRGWEQVLDRDGRPFRVRDGRTGVGAYDYPDPQAGTGWRKLPVKLAVAGVRQSAGIYRADGSLVRLLLADTAGITELWWDGRTDTGVPAPAGAYLVKSVAHDVRLCDDGSFGDNGSPLGMFNPDSPARILPLPDGGFLVGCLYDEAGMTVRRYTSSGFSIHGANHYESGLQVLATNGNEIYELLAKTDWRAGTQESISVVRLSADGERIPLHDGVSAYPVQRTTVAGINTGGLAVVGTRAYVSLHALNLVRVLDLTTGARVAEYPLPDAGDIIADADGTVWALSGTDIVALNADGAFVTRLPTGLAHPMYLAVAANRFAVADMQAGRILLLDRQGKTLKSIGNGYAGRDWAAVGADTLRAIYGLAFLADGKLAIAMSNRVRILWPDTGVIFKDIVSTFVDTGVVHPKNPAYVYSALGVYHVDPVTGAWQWVTEAPQGWTVKSRDGKDATMNYGMPIGAVLLQGTPYVVYMPQSDPTVGVSASAYFFDVSDPARPRLRKEIPQLPQWGWWQNVTFARNGDLYLPVGATKVRIMRYLGPDATGAPQYEAPTAGKVIGLEKDPDTTRGMEHKQAPALDNHTGDVFELAVTKYNNKMIAGWGANTTGLGKYRADGTPLWFMPSSGSTYVALDAADDGKHTWLLACKAFGAQVDCFDTDGLRLATSNWNWPNAYMCGFVDIRYGIRAFLDPAGVVKAYLEDDSIGRVNRIRLEGADTVRRVASPLVWRTPPADAGPIPDAQRCATTSVRRTLTIPRVRELPVNGDWSAWERAGVVPQMLVLPIPSFRRAVPEDVLQTLREGTALGAFAHDGTNLYVYYVVANASSELAASGAEMYASDSLEFWAEEEQFGLGLLQGNLPALYKYRYHSREGKPYTPGHPFPAENVWGVALDDLAAHPLGRLLAANTGVSFTGKKGYAVMAKIPFDEIKLTGGIAGRNGDDVLNMTGQAGETLRLGVNISGILAPGREQDFKMGWPSGILFADPSSLHPFVLGE